MKRTKNHTVAFSEAEEEEEEEEKTYT
jgi:hypothetical protein